MAQTKRRETAKRAPQRSRRKASKGDDPDTDPTPTTVEPERKVAKPRVTGERRAVCRNWESTGQCKFGAKCRFEHTERKTETSEVQPTPTERANGPEGPEDPSLELEDTESKPMWRFSLGPNETKTLKKMGLTNLSDPRYPELPYPAIVLASAQRLCNAMRVGWANGPFEGNGDGASAAFAAGFDSTADYILELVAPAEYTSYGSASFVMKNGEVCCKWRAGETSAPMVLYAPLSGGLRPDLGPVARDGPVVMWGPRSEHPCISMHDVLTQVHQRAESYDTIKVPHQIGGLATTQEISILRGVSGFGYCLAVSDGEKKTYVVPQEYIATAKSFFLEQPARTPAGFLAAVRAVSSRDRSHATQHYSEDRSDLIFLAVLIAYRDFDLQYSVLWEAWDADTVAFNEALAGRVHRRCFRRLVPILTASLVISMIAVMGRFWHLDHGLLAIVGAGMLPIVLAILLGVAVHWALGPTVRLGGARAPAFTPRVQPPVADPFQDGAFYHVGDQVRDPPSLGVLRDSVFPFEGTIRAYPGPHASRAVRTGSCTRIGCAVAGVVSPVVFATGPRDTVAAALRFLNDVDGLMPTSEAPKGLNRLALDLFEPLMKALPKGSCEFQRKLCDPLVVEFLSEYKESVPPARYLHVCNVLRGLVKGKPSLEEVTTGLSALYATEAFGKKELGLKRLRLIENLSEWAVVLLGIPARKLASAAKARFPLPVTVEGVAWHQRFTYGAGRTVDELATFGKHVYGSYRCMPYDFSRWDGSIPIWLMAAFYGAFRLAGAAGDFMVMLLRFLRHDLKIKIRQNKTARFSCAGKVFTGSPFTTVGNTLMHYLVVMYVVRDLKLEDYFVWLLAGGDDGLILWKSNTPNEVAARFASRVREVFGMLIEPKFTQPEEADFFSRGGLGTKRGGMSSSPSVVAHSTVSVGAWLCCPDKRMDGCCPSFLAALPSTVGARSASPSTERGRQSCGGAVSNRSLNQGSCGIRSGFVLPLAPLGSAPLRSRIGFTAMGLCPRG